METYRVEIVEIGTNKVAAIIGHNLNEKQMEKRIKTGLMKANLDKFFVKEVEEK